MIAELEAEVGRLTDALREAKNALFAAKAAEYPHKVGDIFKVPKGEFKITRIANEFGNPAPVAVKRLKGGAWGAADRRLYSWDLERGEKIGHEQPEATP